MVNLEIIDGLLGGAIQALRLDESISEIMFNEDGTIWTERAGVLEQQPIRVEQNVLLTAIQTIARTVKDDFSESKPILDARLADGSRVAALHASCTLGAHALTIRKFQPQRWTLERLIVAQAITAEMVATVYQAILDHKNVLISGGTGTGKTTMLNALAGMIPVEDRICLIEDTSEIQLRAPNLNHYQARREQTDNHNNVLTPAITMRDLLKAALRHRPDRIILGEIRGDEAFELLQALNTGHGGTFSTIHANSTTQALSRLTDLVLQSGTQIPYEIVQRQTALVVHVLVHIQRTNSRRYVSELAIVEGYDRATAQFRVKILYKAQSQLPSNTDSLAALHAATSRHFPMPTPSSGPPPPSDS